MADRNLSRVRAKEKIARNKEAFAEIFGDPFYRTSSVQGHYHTLQNRSSIAAVRFNFDEITGSHNPACPNTVDFICDVERTVQIALPNPVDQKRFAETYLFETTTTAFTPTERFHVEQNVGRLLRAYGISPVARYFTSNRQSVRK